MEKIYLIECRNDSWDFKSIVCACTNKKTAELKKKHYNLIAEGNDYYEIKTVNVWKATDNKWLEDQIKLVENSKLPY